MDQSGEPGTERAESVSAEPIGVAAGGEEWCGVACATSVLDRKWHPVVVDRLLAADVLRFNELLDEIDGITNKPLSVALADLAENGIVSRTVVDSRPIRVEYALTERGRSLSPVIDALDRWGTTHTVPVQHEAGRAESE